MGPHIACVRRWPIIHTHHVCLQAAAKHLEAEGRTGAGQYIILVSDGYQTSGGDEGVIGSVTGPFKADGGLILSLAAGGDETGEQKIREKVMQGIAAYIH